MYYLVSLDARYWRKIERHCVLLLHTCLARQLMVVPWTHIEVFYVCFQVKLKEEEEEEGRNPLFTIGGTKRKTFELVRHRHVVVCKKI